MKILIADDELTTRMLVQVSLENWGYRVESVVDGDEAWSILKQEGGFNIVILDWEMPKLDGIDVCRRIKEMDLDNPPYIILLTARDSKKDIVKGFDAGADDYMTKPFNDNELRARVRVAERLVRTQTSLADTVSELEEMLNLLETSQEGVEVCPSCCKIRCVDDQWLTLQESVDQHANLHLIHTNCPDCSGDDNKSGGQ